MKKKILFILNGLGKGGIVSSFSSLYDSIREDYDIKVLVLSTNKTDNCPFGDDIISDNLLTSYNYPINTLNQKQKLLKLLLSPYRRIYAKIGVRLPNLILNNVVCRLQKKYKFDIVVGYSEGLPTLVASKFKVKKKISWIHCDYKRYYDTVCIKNDELGIYENIDIINCVSKYTQDSFVKIYPSLEGKVQFIYNLYDVGRIKKLSLEAIDDKRFKTDLFTIVSVGRVDPVKRFSEIPQIAAQLKKNGLKFRWYILGPETRHKEDLLLKERILKYGVDDVVLWLGNKPNPYSYMAASNLYVCLSSSEACPMVFIEAKILGLPIVTTDFGSAYEFIHDGEGYIFNIKDLPHEIERLVLNPLQMNQLKEHLNKTNYNNEKSIAQLETLFK